MSTMTHTCYDTRGGGRFPGLYCKTRSFLKPPESFISVSEGAAPNHLLGYSEYWDLIYPEEHFLRGTREELLPSTT